MVIATKEMWNYMCYSYQTLVLCSIAIKLVTTAYSSQTLVELYGTMVNEDSVLFTMVYNAYIRNK